MTTSPKIVITDWGFASLDPERAVFAPHGINLVDCQCKTEEELMDAVQDADIVIAQWAPVKARAIAAMTKCRGIVRYGIGLDNIDLEAARNKNIPVRNIPDYCLNEVADHTLALMLSMQRQVTRVHGLVCNGTWKIVPPQPFPALRQCTLGLIGFGRIARLVAQRAKAFGIRIVATDKFADPMVFQEAGVESVELDALLKISDIISLHCPLTDETRHLINAQALEKLKPLAIIVNTSRGGLIDTEALTKALQENRLGGAALDVLEQEPIDQASPMLHLPNVIINSHISWYSGASVQELQRLAAVAAVELLNLQG